MDVLADTCQDEESKFGNEVQFTYKLGNAKREEKVVSCYLKVKYFSIWVEIF